MDVRRSITRCAKMLPGNTILQLDLRISGNSFLHVPKLFNSYTHLASARESEFASNRCQLASSN